MIIRNVNSPAFVLLVLVAWSCADTTSEKWSAAQTSWEQRDPKAFALWRALDPGSTEGQEARKLLARAESYYLVGIRLFEEDDATGARAQFLEGARLAPIDPKHYISIARLCREAGLDESEAKYLKRYLSAIEGGREAKWARGRLRELELGPGSIFEGSGRRDALSGGVSVPVLLLVAGAITGLFVIVLLLVLRRGGGVSLPRLIERHPELHAAIAYLIGSLRHELLKHRIGAVGDIVVGARSDFAGVERQSFLFSRLYGKVPVKSAWDAHLGAFVGAIGHRFDYRRDRLFKEAARAFQSIAELEKELLAGSAGAFDKLARAHKSLVSFDRYLASQQKLLVRAFVDEALLLGAVTELKGEFAVASIELDELSCQAPDESVWVGVPRADLLLIIKNILRNAVFAVAGEEDNRRVRLEVREELEPTGEESVLICVGDSSARPLTTTDLRGGDPGTGLGLVSSAVKRYGGAVSVRKTTGDFKKEVVIRFFRSFENGDES